jgi:hypothetical protein
MDANGMTFGSHLLTKSQNVQPTAASTQNSIA